MPIMFVFNANNKPICIKTNVIKLLIIVNIIQMELTVKCVNQDMI